MAVAPDFDNDEPIPGTSLEGLGHAWEADECIRGHALQNGGSLLSWPTPKHVGVINVRPTMPKCCPSFWSFGALKSGL